jgi:hypothetical protein
MNARLLSGSRGRGPIDAICLNGWGRDERFASKLEGGRTLL